MTTPSGWSFPAPQFRFRGNGASVRLELFDNVEPWNCGAIELRVAFARMVGLALIEESSEPPA